MLSARASNSLVIGVFTYELGRDQLVDLRLLVDEADLLAYIDEESEIVVRDLERPVGSWRRGEAEILHLDRLKLVRIGLQIGNAIGEAVAECFDDVGMRRDPIAFRH